jgi:hypothetical protein
MEFFHSEKTFESTGSSKNWRAEAGQLRQFITLPSAAVLELIRFSINDAVQSNLISPLYKGTLIAKAVFTSDLEAYPSQSLSDYLSPPGASGIDDPQNTLQQDQKQNFDNWIQTNIGNIRSGDYLWINALNGGHALLIVGWGRMENCSVSVNGGSYIRYTLLPYLISNPVQPTELTMMRPTNTGTVYYVPYVADFSGIGKGSTANHIQNTAARPFYCTHSNTPRRFGSYYGSTGYTYWYFMTMPDSVSIDSPTSASNARLHVSNYWNWNPTGTILNQQGTTIPR